MFNVTRLIEGNGALFPIASDLDTQEGGPRAQIVHAKMLRKIIEKQLSIVEGQKQ